MGCVKTGQVFTVLRPILGGCHLTGSAQASDLTSNVTFLGPPTAHISTTESKPTEQIGRKQTNNHTRKKARKDKQTNKQETRGGKQAVIGTYLGQDRMGAD